MSERVSNSIIYNYLVQISLNACLATSVETNTSGGIQKGSGASEKGHEVGVALIKHINTQWQPLMQGAEVPPH